MKIAALVSEFNAERQALQARLDAIDLVLDNLQRVYPETKKAAKTAKVAKAVKPATGPVRVDAGEAAARRDVLLSVIGKSTVGVTLGELRKQTPKMDGKDRSNALQTLKVNRQIKRVGNAWIKAA